MIGCVCQIISTRLPQKGKCFWMWIIPHGLENKINYMTHYSVRTRQLFKWCHFLASPAFCCFAWRSLAISGIPLLAPKSILHIQQILIEHPSHHIMCVSVCVLLDLWAPWMEKAMPHSSPISLLPGIHMGTSQCVWRKVSVDRMCFGEGCASLLCA